MVDLREVPGKGCSEIGQAYTTAHPGDKSRRPQDILASQAKYCPQHPRQYKQQAGMGRVCLLSTEARDCIDIEACEYCGGQVKIIASMEDPAVIALVLKHFDQKATS